MPKKKTENKIENKFLSNFKAKLKDNKKLLSLLLTITILVIIFGSGFYSKKQDKYTGKSYSEAAKILESPQKLAAASSNSSLKYQVDGDIVYGKDDAPVTIIEYASLSCSHCANFYNNTFKEIDKRYIKTGKVKFIYRHFPLNQSAVLASTISLCNLKNNNDKDRYYKFIKVLFETQDSWAYSKDFLEKIRSIAKLDAMTTKQFDACLNDSELVNKIIEERMRASKELQIKSTPSFVVAGEIVRGSRGFNYFKELIEAKLNN